MTAQVFSRLKKCLRYTLVLRSVFVYLRYFLNFFSHHNLLNNARFQAFPLNNTSLPSISFSLTVKWCTPMDSQKKQDDQLEHTFSSYVKIRDVALKNCQRRWTIGRSGERGSGISVLAARHYYYYYYYSFSHHF